MRTRTWFLTVLVSSFVVRLALNNEMQAEILNTTSEKKL